MINPPDRRYPGPGRPPTATDQGRYMRSVDALQQGQGADGGTGGVGIDSQGTQFRDWGAYPILARIDGNAGDNAYGFVEVYIDDTGNPQDTPNGLTSDGTDIPAYEVNDNEDVEDDTIVELWPNYSLPGSLTFTTGSGSATNRGLVDASVHAVAGDDWPDDPLDVFFRRVDRDDLGVLQEVTPAVEYGRRPGLVDSTSAGSSDGDAVTTGSLDTTGATGLFLTASWDPTTTADAAVTDSKGNTWVGLTAKTNGIRKTRIFYSPSPSVGSGHTFTVTATDGLPTVGVAAFSAVELSPFDVENGNTGTGTTLTTGSVTPTVPYSVVIAALSANDSSGTPAAIDSDFTAETVGQSADHVAGGLAWKILSASATEDPEWSWTNSGVAAAAIAVFKGTGPVYEHADLPWRCVDPDDGTVTYQIPLFKDDRNIQYAEWDEWYSINTERELADVSVTQNPVTCAYTVTKTYECHDHIQSFFNTPKLTEIIVPTPPTYNCVDGVCVEADCGTPGTYATLADCEADCP